MDKNESLEVKNKEGERKFSEKIEELTKEREILQIKLQKKEEERKKVTNQIQA
jgi:hypothetical protein